ncbi:response regulator [Microbacterium sp. YJN-G]|uniref:response regulator n=1 Tax=Microbacterium sp. YJN-G TaxID=2763257 RepID=UPI001877729E|nr:response regulator transcription factor [Microbacterium sp. YJN-G]
MSTVFLVDDHEIVRQGLAAAIDSQEGLRVIGEASNVADAVHRIAATEPDVAVLDLRLPDGNGIDLCRQIRQSQPEVNCLILTAYDDDDAMFAAVVAGASGYLLKSVRAAELIDAIRRVASGGRLLHAQAERAAVQRMRDATQEDPRFGSLGLRERQILALIADGLTNRQIGERLGLAEKTVKNYVSGLLSKLGLDHRTQAAVFEVERARGGSG